MYMRGFAPERSTRMSSNPVQPPMGGPAVVHDLTFTTGVAIPVDGGRPLGST